jgi:hypothetical protein
MSGCILKHYYSGELSESIYMHGVYWQVSVFDMVRIQCSSQVQSGGSMFENGIDDEIKKDR